MKESILETLIISFLVHLQYMSNFATTSQLTIIKVLVGSSKLLV